MPFVSSTPFRSFTFVLLALTTTACSDDEGAVVIPSAEAGPGDTSSAATQSSGTTDGTVPEEDASVSACSILSAACRGVDDPDGVAELCVELAESASDPECSMLSNTCLTYCNSGQLPSPEAGAPNREQCDEMGELCHEYDQGSGLGHACHEVGHAGDLAGCSVIYAACADLCHIGAADAGGAHGHETSDASHHEVPDASHHVGSDAGSHSEPDADHQVVSDASQTGPQSSLDAAADGGN